MDAKMKITMFAAFCCAAFTLSAKEAVVFVGAHPDDTEGFAATAFLLRDKYDIHIVDLTRGERGLGMEGLYDGSTGIIRVREEIAACKLLGATPHFLHEVNGWAYASESSVHTLTKIFAKLKPIAVFTHWPVDTHPDHVLCAGVVSRALEDANLRDDPQRYFFEVEQCETRNYVPLYYVDVTSTISNKVELIRCYACQNKDDKLAQLKVKEAQWRGAQRSPAVAYAETFTTFDGKPIKDGVIESLPETAIVGR